MVGARFLFGVGAAGAYPNAAGVISRWFPKKEHARAQGFIWGAGRLGGALAPLLARAHWSSTLAGTRSSRCSVWAWHGRPSGGCGFAMIPEEMSGISDEELAEIRAGQMARGRQQRCPWAKLLRVARSCG